MLQYLLAQVHTLTDEQVKMQSNIQSLQSSAESEPAASSSPQPVADPEPQRAHLFHDAASPEPEPCAGDPGACSGFLLLCELAFGRSPALSFQTQFKFPIY